jgi:hypothetical protein
VSKTVSRLLANLKSAKAEEGEELTDGYDSDASMTSETGNQASANVPVATSITESLSEQDKSEKRMSDFAASLLEEKGRNIDHGERSCYCRYTNL